MRLATLHDVAAFLNPCMKGLKFITPSRKRAALESVSKMISDTDDGTSSNGQPINSALSTEDHEVTCSVVVMSNISSIVILV